MPAVSNCPKCDAQVSIPPAAPGETEVRCPLCSEEYLLQEALDKAPPELILVNPPEKDAVPAFAAGVADGDDEGESDSGGLGFFGDAGELKLEDETSSFSFGDDEGSSATATKLQVRRKRKRPGMMFQAGGIVGGGVIGLVAAYFILLWVFGKDLGYDFGGKDFAARNILWEFLVPGDLRKDETVKQADKADPEDDGDDGDDDERGTGGSNDFQGSPVTGSPVTGSPVTGSAVANSRASFKEAFGGGKKSETDPPEPTDLDSPLNPNLPVDPFSVDPLPVESLPVDPFSVDLPAAPTPKVGLKTAPSFTSDELGTALAAVKKSIKALEESEATGRFRFVLKLQLFKDLCALGESYTFAEGEADDGMFQGRLAAAGRLAGMADDGKLKFSEIGRLAEGWLPAGARGDQTGVLLAGTVDDVGNIGDFFKVTLLLAGSPSKTQVVVMFEDNPDLGHLDEVLILGYIVDTPQDNLHDYEGDEAVVVWARVKGIARTGSTEM